MTNHAEETQRFVSNIPCIPSNYSRLIARVLELQGRDLPSLLELTQLSVTQFMQQDTLLTSQQQVQILDNMFSTPAD